MDYLVGVRKRDKCLVFLAWVTAQMVLLVTKWGHFGREDWGGKYKISIGESPVGCDTSRIPYPEIR